MSASYSLTANDKKFDEYVKELNELFDKYEKKRYCDSAKLHRGVIGEV